MVSTRELARTVAGLADDHGGVLSRALLGTHGIGRDRIRNEVAAGRWVLGGRHTVALHTGPLGDGIDRHGTVPAFDQQLGGCFKNLRSASSYPGVFGRGIFFAR